MTRVVRRRPLARKDIAECAIFIGHNNLDAAQRFLDAARSTGEFLLKMPEIGSPCNFQSSELQDIKEFE